LHSVERGIPLIRIAGVQPSFVSGVCQAHIQRVTIRPFCLVAVISGMEAAAYCVEKVKSVTVVGRDTVPFRGVLGEEVGARLMALHKEKGVLFKMESGVTRFIAGPSGDTVNQVELKDGSTLPADVCILGIGSSPATKFLDGSGVNVDKRGAIIVNKVMGILFCFTLPSWEENCAVR
jgi:Uncharacterized NAD(FAD)-dependent dehydrogenases